MIDKIIIKFLSWVDNKLSILDFNFPKSKKKIKMLNHQTIEWTFQLNKKNNFVIPVLGFVLAGLSGWLLSTVVELQVLLAMLQEEILNLNKDISRLYHYMDKLIK